jgi:antitoxin ParD1/3/4
MSEVDRGSKICYHQSMASKVQKISIALTPELNAIVQDAVSSGHYASASEVMRDALRYWDKREKAKAAAYKYVRALIKAGIDSGPSEFTSMEDVIAEAKRRNPELLKKSA